MASVAKGKYLSYMVPSSSFLPILYLISPPKIMLRVCLLLPILLLAGAPLSRAQEEDQEVREKNISGQIIAVKSFCGFQKLAKLRICFPCQVSWFQDMMAFKRANPEDSPTFFAVRGKKNVLKPNSLFGALSGKRFTR